MSEKSRINQMLMSRGLGKLTDPGLVPQLGFLMGLSIKDHEAFRELLNKCKPAERRNMYEAMRSYLSFEVKPLDVYVAELGQLAEAKQMPVIAEDGTLKPFNVIDIQTREPLELRKAEEQALAQSLIEEAAAIKHLSLLCHGCTRVEHFHGWTKDAAVAKARSAGWRSYVTAGDQEFCPVCAQ